MVLISEGIICTRCAGEKRHKANDCPKPATAADFITDHVPGAGSVDSDGMDNVDSGMESLSDTSSVSSESTARSDSSEMQVTNAHRSGQGGNHAHLSRRGFAPHAASYTSTQPDRTSLSTLNRRAGHLQAIGKANGQVSRTATPETDSRHNRDIIYGHTSPAYSIPRSVPTNSTGLPCKKNSSIKKLNDKKRKGSHSHDDSTQQVGSYRANEDRLPSKSLAETMRKFEYSDTTCPSSFGFGRLPSEAMG